MKRISILFILFACVIPSCERDKYENFTGDSGTFIDSRDAQEYKWVRIGDQIWMAENLNYDTVYGSWVYESLIYDTINERWVRVKDLSNAEIYGRLYNWETACKLCPAGFHLPDSLDWEKLIAFLGGYSIAGGKMKESGFTHWNSPNEGASNESSFSALPGGLKLKPHPIDLDPGEFRRIGIAAYFWSNMIGPHPYCRELNYENTTVKNYVRFTEEGLSVRCLKDE
jgi:uncharacterized protein (TIGR02145 family)